MYRMLRPLRTLNGYKNNYWARINSYLREKLVLPIQTSADKKIFKSVFQQYAGKRVSIFEWGSGRSTIYYSRYLASIGADYEWHAIDNSEEWQEKVALLINRFGLNDSVHLYFSEFPAFWELPEWSWKEKIPPKDICTPKVIEYVDYPRRLAGPKGFDIIIVDGRFRRRCLLTAPEVLAPGGMVLLHDAQSLHYQNSLEKYKLGRFFDVGTLPGSRVKINTWLGTLDNSRVPFIESLGNLK